MRHAVAHGFSLGESMAVPVAFACQFANFANVVNKKSITSELHVLRAARGVGQNYPDRSVCILRHPWVSLVVRWIHVNKPSLQNGAPHLLLESSEPTASAWHMP